MGHFWLVQNFLLSFYSNESLTKWDTLFEISQADMFITFQPLLVQIILHCVFSIASDTQKVVYLRTNLTQKNKVFQHTVFAMYKTVLGSSIVTTQPIFINKL